MKALLLCLLSVLIVVPPTPTLAQAQAPDATTTIRIVENSAGPSELRLTGPASVDTGEPVMLVVRGLPAVDLGRTVGEQTQWIQTLRFECSAPDGAVVEIDKELSMSVSPWEWRLRLTFVPPVAGVYLVVCDWNESPFGLALHRVEAGPNDPPPPPPPPPPQQAQSALILMETTGQGEELARQLNLFRNQPVSAKVEILYRKTQNQGGQPDVLVEAALAYLSGRPLPRLVFLSSAGAPVADVALPSTSTAIIAALAERGVK